MRRSGFCVALTAGVLGACYSGRVTYARSAGLAVDTKGRVGVEAGVNGHLLTVGAPEDGTGFQIGGGGTLGYRGGSSHVVDGTMGASLGAVRLPDDWGFKILFGMNTHFSTDGMSLAPTLTVGLLKSLDDTPGDLRMLELDLVTRAQLSVSDADPQGWFGLMIGYRRLREWNNPPPGRRVSAGESSLRP